MSNEEMEFNIDTELIEYIFRKSTHDASVYNTDVLMSTLQDQIKKIKTVDELQNLFGAYENLIMSTGSVALMQLNIMACYIPELRMYHMAINKTNEENTTNIEPYDLNRNVLNMLYSYFLLEHILHLLQNAKDLTVLNTSKEKLEQFIKKYEGMLLDINKVVIPNMDMFLSPKVLEEFAIKKSLYLTTGVPVMLYQYDLLLNAMLKKYSNVTLTIDQIAGILRDELKDKFAQGYTYDTVKEIVSKY